MQTLKFSLMLFVVSGYQYLMQSSVSFKRDSTTYSVDSSQTSKSWRTVTCDTEVSQITTRYMCMYVSVCVMCSIFFHISAYANWTYFLSCNVKLHIYN